VLISKQLNTILSNYWIPSVTISVRSVASVTTTGGDCILALDTNADSGTFSASGTPNIQLNQCGIGVNSSNTSSALSLNGNASVSALSVSIVGGVSDPKNKLSTTNGVTKITVPFTDPYASVALPSPSLPCPPVNTAKVIGASTTLQAGTYCSGMTISGGTVTLSAGTYIFYQGVLSMTAQSKLVGTSDVTIILTGASGNYANIQMTGQSTIHITAPTSGTLKGLAILQNASATTSSSFAGGTGNTISGAMVFPNTSVTYTGNSASASACTQLVAWKVNFNGDASFNNNCAGFGILPIGASSFASLSE
jgi:hypothetical protein